MSLIGIGAKVGYLAGRNLPKAVKVAKVASVSGHGHAIAYTYLKAVWIANHAAVVGLKIAAASTIGILGAHWIGL